MPQDKRIDFESALELDLQRVRLGEPPVLTSEDFTAGLLANASVASFATIVAAAHHPAVPAEWVRAAIEDPTEVGLPAEMAIDLHYALAENKNLPPMLLSMLLAEHPAGDLDEALILNPNLPGRALDVVTRRLIPEPGNWRALGYVYSVLIAAYAHPNLTDDTGRRLTHVFLDLWDSDPPSRDDDNYSVIVRNAIPEIVAVLVAASMNPDRQQWFTSEERSRLLVHQASA